MRVFLNDVVMNKTYSDIYLIKSCNIRQTSKGKDYMSITISDMSGEISGVVWNMPAEYEKFQSGEFCRAAFTVGEYEGNKQANFLNLCHVSPEEDFDREGLVPTSSTPSDEAYRYIYGTAEKFQNADLRRLTTTILRENKDNLLRWPGAKGVHHATLGGLIEHTHGMLRLAEAICMVYPGVNRELLLAGVILHDIAKIKEFALGSIGLVADYSTEGKLLGHLYMGGRYIADKCEELAINGELSLVLQHMIISHHGKPEFGAVKIPEIWEANLLHQIDDMDAKSYIYRTTLDKLEPGTFSDKVFALDNVQIYKPNLD